MEANVKPKMALCIRRIDAPAAVRAVTHGTHCVPITEEFFSTPVHLSDRAHCETDPSQLQLLPYIVIVERITGKVFCYSRGKGGTEDRLHGKLSVGVGGHVETMPDAGVNLFDHLKADAMRESFEEIGVAPREIAFDCLIYNPTGVNEVHLAVLGIALVDKIEGTEKGVIEKGEFRPVSELVKDDGIWQRLEDWSKAALWRIDALARTGNPIY